MFYREGKDRPVSLGKKYAEHLRQGGLSHRQSPDDTQGVDRWSSWGVSDARLDHLKYRYQSRPMSTWFVQAFASSQHVLEFDR